MPLRARELDVGESGCTLRFDAGSVSLTWRWLRDHARDDASYLASAEQRLVRPTDVAAAGPGSASLVGDGEALAVVWPDGTDSTWTIGWLLAADGDAAGATSIERLVGRPEPWRGADLDARLVRITHHDLLSRDGLARALRGLTRDGVVVATGVPVDRDATRRCVERFGPIRSTIFGSLWEFRSDGGFDDTASTPLEITPHTDGTYCHDAPGLLALHCHRYEATGGENVFVCGHALSDRLAAESPRHHELLRTIEVPGRYVGDGAHLMARRPALRVEGGELRQISYNHHDRAPFRLPEPTMTELLDALAHLDAIAADPAMQFELALRPGDLVVFDNWRVLHGRRAFDGERLIAGGYVSREDLESTVRRELGGTFDDRRGVLV